MMSQANVKRACWGSRIEDKVSARYVVHTYNPNTQEGKNGKVVKLTTAWISSQDGKTQFKKEISEEKNRENLLFKMVYLSQPKS